jgi:alkaline phosphatase D
MNGHFLFCLFLFVFTVELTFADKENLSDFEFKIAFGSCGKQSHPLPIFNEVVKQVPNLFIFLGDNIYGDTHDMDILRKKYQELGDKESYKNLIKNTDVLATWDDHDYGQNDAGKHYPHKEESKEIFLDFLKNLKIQRGINTRGFIIQFIRKQEIKSFRSFS